MKRIYYKLKSYILRSYVRIYVIKLKAKIKLYKEISKAVDEATKETIQGTGKQEPRGILYVDKNEKREEEDE